MIRIDESFHCTGNAHATHILDFVTSSNQSRKLPPRIFKLSTFIQPQFCFKLARELRKLTALWLKLALVNSHALLFRFVCGRNKQLPSNHWTFNSYMHEIRENGRLLLTVARNFGPMQTHSSPDCLFLKLSACMSVIYVIN